MKKSFANLKKVFLSYIENKDRNQQVVCFNNCIYLYYNSKQEYDIALRELTQYYESIEKIELVNIPEFNSISKQYLFEELKLLKDSKYCTRFKMKENFCIEIKFVKGNGEYAYLDIRNKTINDIYWNRDLVATISTNMIKDFECGYKKIEYLSTFKEYLDEIKKIISVIKKQLFGAFEQLFFLF